MNITDLKTLLVHELKDLYSAENQLLKALPKMATAAHHPKLKQLNRAFEEHLEESREHVRRLEQVFASLDYQPGGHHCAGMAGLLEEGSDMIAEDAPNEVKDAGLICAAQRVEHYEMAGYGCARTFARLLGMNDVAETLQKTLDEEGAADQKLTKIAEQTVNAAAVDG